MAQTIYLVYLRLEHAPQPDAGWLARLPAAYRERLESMRSPSARRQTLAGLRLLETGGAHVGLPVDLARLRLRADDRPRLARGPVFSISHAGDFCVCALARHGLLGVDVERERPLATTRILRLLNDDERAAVALDPGAFFAAWTAREAVAKATGRVGLRRIGQVGVDSAGASIDGTRFWLRRPALAPGYQLCIAGDTGDPAIEIQELTEPSRKNSAA